MIYFILGITGVVLLLLLICIVRALLIKPTSASMATIRLEPDSRSTDYGSKLATLVQKETISSRFDEDRTKFLEFHKLLENMFPKLHSACDKKVFNGSLLYKWPGTSNAKSILLMSHHDVVEASGDWKHEPFSGDIDEDGRIWGRGTVDTKASLFCILTAAEELIASGHTPECDVYIASSCTEEWSGEGAPSTVKYLEEQGVRPALVLDEGGMILTEPMAGVKGTYGMVGVVEKGYGDVKFIARSTGGHASAPTKNTPLVRLARFMLDIEKKDPFKKQFSPALEEMFRRLAPNMNFGMKFIFTNMWLFKPLLTKLLPSINSTAGAMLKTTLAFTTAKGSDGLNVLPMEAYVTGNMRFIQHQPNDESLALLKKKAERYNIEMEVIYQDRPCPYVDYTGKAFKLIEQVAATVYPGVGISPYVMTGGTDAKYYTRICDNCIRFAPLYIDKQQHASIHGVNENIYVAALPYAVDFYKEIIKNSGML